MTYTQTAFDLAVEDQAMSRPVAVANAHYNGLNFNRLIAVRMAYLKGQFTEWPQEDNA